MRQDDERPGVGLAGKRGGGWFIFPFLLAAFPALSLAASNAREIATADLIRPVALSLLGAGLVFMLFCLVLRDCTSGAFATACVVLLFFTYGHVYGFLKGAEVGGEPLGRHRYLIPLFVALAVLGLRLASRRRLGLPRVAPILTAVAAVLVLVPVVQLITNAFVEASSEDSRATRSRRSFLLSPPGDAPLPDIYYIILDGYGRSDVLLETYAYDNSDFLRQLRTMGFYVAEESHSNYAYTILSIASSLNYSYLQDIGVGLSGGQSAEDWAMLTALIKHSQIRGDLASLGYSMVALESGYRPTNVTDADLHLSPRSGLSGMLQLKALLAPTPFETMLIDTTALKTLMDGGVVLSGILSPAIRVPYERHRQRILFQLDSLKAMPRLEGPKFVFAHLVVPHEPYVFGPNGEWRTPEEVFTLANHDAEESEGTDRRGYTDQAAFIEKQMLDVLRTILRDSETRPVIILQADHGLPISDVTPAGRMAILNAYYLPIETQEELYPEISPVNSFRLVLTGLFGARLPLLEDVAYFSGYPNLFDMTRVDSTRSALDAGSTSE